jgi:hypothetical protein
MSGLGRNNGELARNLLNLPILALGCFVSAVLGDSVGYWTGNRFGRKLFQKEDSWLFHKKHIVSAQRFYNKRFMTNTDEKRSYWRDLCRSCEPLPRSWLALVQ